MGTKIIAITGLSGTGKTTIVDTLSDLLNIRKIVSVTDRPKRPSEEHGKDYYFVTKEEFEFLRASIIAKESFKVASGDIWNYGILQSALDNEYIVLSILTPKGVEELRDLGYDITSIHIYVDEEERLKRIFNRKDNQSKEEINRRSKADSLKFLNFNPDYIVENDDISNCLANIIRIISEKM